MLYAKDYDGVVYSVQGKVGDGPVLAARYLACTTEYIAESGKIALAVDLLRCVQ